MADKKQPQPPHVVRGDEIYVQHPEKGAISAKVLAVGKDGVSIAHDDGHVGVRWGAVLGHKKRRERNVKVVEEGEDGFIAEDEDGKRVFVRGGMDEPDDEDDGEPMQKALLLDVGGLSCCCTNHALEEMHKAMSEGEILDFVKHESPFISDLIEKYHAAGLLKLEHIRDLLTGFLEGSFHIPGAAVPALPMLHNALWTEGEKTIVLAYLQALPPDQYKLTDWELLVDYLAQRYLPQDVLASEAEAFAVKASVMGKVEAHFAAISAGDVAAIMAAVPPTIVGVQQSFALADAAMNILRFGTLRCTDAVTAFSEAVRHALKKTILDHQYKVMAGDPEATPGKLQQTLLERFGQFNRDWRMIAVTEAGEMCNQGLLAALPRDSYVRRMEMYFGACSFCKKLDGRVFRVTSASDPHKDGEKDVWVGKTNVGRSASPKKRVGDVLVEREPDERWWCAAGTQHPHCRGRWEPVRRLGSDEDPAFAKWLMENAGVKFGLPTQMA